MPCNHNNNNKEFDRLLSMLFKPHPFHGVSAESRVKGAYNAYIEIVPDSTVKLETGKVSAHLEVDRPQRANILCPTPYGWIPQTDCGESVAELSMRRGASKRIKGDGDALDVCVLTSKQFAHGDLFMKVRPIGGLPMIDKGEADDKIIAVLVADRDYGKLEDISQCPPGLIDEIVDYFLTYKKPSGTRRNPVKIKGVYGRDEALEVIRRSRADYVARYGTHEDRLKQMRKLLAHSLCPKCGS